MQCCLDFCFAADYIVIICLLSISLRKSYAFMELFKRSTKVQRFEAFWVSQHEDQLAEAFRVRHSEGEDASDHASTYDIVLRFTLRQNPAVNLPVRLRIAIKFSRSVLLTFTLLFL